MDIKVPAPPDIDAIYNIELDVFGAADAWSYESFVRMLSSPKKREELFCAYENGEMLGFVAFMILPDELYITNVAVRNLSRGQGIGTALIDRVFEFAKEKNIVRAVLDVRESNAAAAAFYGKLGFTVCGRGRGQYDNPREDALIMEHSL